jgi:hypothetical protein
MYLDWTEAFADTTRPPGLVFDMLGVEGANWIELANDVMYEGEYSEVRVTRMCVVATTK